MSAFNEARLLDRVAYGSEFGHRYNTSVRELRSGVERRNAEWQRPLGRYAVRYQNLDTRHHQIVIAAHHACMGRLIGFRFRDWTDFTAEDAVIGYGTGATENYQLCKYYVFGTLSSQRDIVKPVNGTVVVSVAGAPVAAQVDYSTGVVQLRADDGAEITWRGEFDVPVRFADDEIGFTFDNRAGGTPILNSDVELVEIRR